MANDSAALGEAFLKAGFSGVRVHEADASGFRASRSGMSFDVLATLNPMAGEMLRRRQRRSLGPLEVWCVCVEDLIILKLQAARPRDLDDAVALVAANKDLDLDLLKDQAEAFAINLSVVGL